MEGAARRPPSRLWVGFTEAWVVLDPALQSDLRHLGFALQTFFVDEGPHGVSAP
jgi:hypothetical protein